MSVTTTKITLLDIPTVLGKAASPHTWRTRIILNHMQLDHVTEWISYVKIEETCKARGIKPTGIRPDGAPHYTLPAVIDSTSSAIGPVIMSGSDAIAKYLDDTYSSGAATSGLFPSDERKERYPEMSTFISQTIMGIVIVMCAEGYMKIQEPEAAEDMRRVVKQRYGITVEEMAPKGADRDEKWTQLRELMEMASDMGGLRSADGKSWRLEKEARLTYGDVMMLALLMCVKVSSEGDGWAKVSSWDDEKWAKYFAYAEAKVWLQVK